MAMILCLARRIPEAADFARSGLWQTWGPGLFLGPDLGGAKIGIVGAGRIGLAVAHRAHAFGTHILYHDRVRQIEIEQELDAQALNFNDLLEQADIVTLHVPLTDQTYHMISHDELGIMKTSALLINTSRGPVVHTEALLEALREGAINAAGLDVTDPEPLPASHPLYELQNCLITPHIASAGTATRTRMAQMAVDNLIAGLEGAALPHSVV
jgi:glyoxylate reductase